MRNKRTPLLAGESESESATLAPSDRLRSDLERLGLGATRIESVAQRLEPLLPTLSPEQYGAVLAGVAAGQASPADAVEDCSEAFPLADAERLMEGVREEVQKLDEGLRMLSAYVTGLRKRAEPRSDDTLH